MFIQSAYAAQNLNPLPAINFGTFVSRTITVLAILAGILAVIFLIYSGIQYITANGEPAKATAARTGIVNAIIGIIVILLAYSIVTWVVNAVNLGNPGSATPITGGGGTVKTPSPTSK